jgi:hypothetical protein
MLMRIRVVLALVVGLAIPLVATACGGDSASQSPAVGTTTGSAAGSEQEEEGEATPAQAAAEIPEIKDLLDHAVEEYREGEAKEAEEVVGDAYLEHFEHVEGPLGELDHELMEEIEVAISTKIRNRIKDGVPVAQVEALVADVKTDLDKAQALLEKGS